MKHKVRDPVTGVEKVVDTPNGLPQELEDAFNAEAEEKANSPVAKVLGLPMQGVNALARAGARAQGLPVDDSATVGQMLRSALAPTPTIAPSSPEEAMSQGLSKAVGPTLEQGANVAMDPTMWLGGGEGASAAGVGPRLGKGIAAAESGGLWEKLAAEARQARGGQVRLGAPPPLSRWEQMAQEARVAQGLDKMGRPLTGASSVGAPPPPPQTLMDKVAGLNSEEAGALIRRETLLQRRAAPPPVGTSDILGVKQSVPTGGGMPDVRDILKRVKAEAATKNMQKPVMRQTVQQLSQELGTSLDAPHLGSGYFHDVHDIGTTANGQPVVLRVNSSPLKGQQDLSWPKSSNIIQPIKRQLVKGVNGDMDRMVEVVPKVPSAKLTDVEMDKLREGLLKDGYSLVDPEGTGGNVTRIKGKPMVVDPGAVVPTPLELEYQKYKNYEGSIPNTPSNAAEIAHAKSVVAQRTARVGMGLGAAALGKMFYDNSGGDPSQIAQPPPSQDLSKLGVPES